MTARPGNSDRTRDTSAGDATGEPAGSRRRMVEIRCGFADRARKEAEAASVGVRDAKRRLTEQTAVVAEAQAAVDPAAIQAAKEEAHRAFRVAVSAARSRNNVEAAASAWLSDINEINGRNRAAQARAKHESEVAEELVSQVAKVSSTAEAAATMAASAIEACRAAMAALEAEDAENVGVVAPGSPAAEPEPAAPPVAEPAAPSVAEPAAPSAAEQPEPAHPASDWLVIDIRSPQPQAIIRLIRRDGKTMNALIDRLAGPDPSARSCWGLLLSSFVDAVAAAAIEDACLNFPEGNPFWGQFTGSESCEVARGLAALGFRFDGFSAFADGRIPGRRDLALAVGSAGLLPARVRYWPGPEEAAKLFHGVSASGDAFIAAMAPALTLGELVRLLGRRAEHLADLWNDWSRVRPLLFQTDL